MIETPQPLKESKRPKPKPQSELGIASCLVALGLFAYVVIRLNFSLSGVIGSNSFSFNVAVGNIMNPPDNIITIVGLLTGFVLALLGRRQMDRKKTFVVLGLVVNGFVASALGLLTIVEFIYGQ